ncbi:hypothetical protein D3C87_79360 [compost metagenome]
MNKYKNFIAILASYKCDKNCPFCIAKMDNLPKKEDNLDLLRESLVSLKNDKQEFKACVISGNGEPSLYSYEFLKTLRNTFDEADIFKFKRIQSSGNIFGDDEKTSLFKGWLIEVTRVSSNYEIDSSVLKYKKDYIITENFKKSNIRMNIVLLKNNINNIVDDIVNYFEFQNIKNIALKILDKNEETKQDKWITQNAIDYDQVDSIIDLLNKNFKYIGFEFQNHMWEYKGKKISLYNNNNYNEDKTQENFMWYGDTNL